ncbi:YggT family protein [Sphingomonas sp. GlSt437]|uniref:YggT family protein n=1 Tax=Sphingomonas sp. GlSt437 TaxID=3389970 RepID=UPI003A87CC08
MITVLDILEVLLHVAQWIIVIQAIMSWLIMFNVINTYNDGVRQVWVTLQRITDPIYRPIRRVMPDFGPLDLSPLVALLILSIISGIIIPRLEAFASANGAVL